MLKTSQKSYIKVLLHQNLKVKCENAYSDFNVPVLITHYNVLF